MKLTDEQVNALAELLVGLQDKGAQRHVRDVDFWGAPYGTPLPLPAGFKKPKELVKKRPKISPEKAKKAKFARLDVKDADPEVIAAARDITEMKWKGFSTTVNLRKSSLEKGVFWISGDVYKDGKKVGFYQRVLDYEDREMENAGLVLSPSVQGQGFAERFYKHVEEKAYEQGIRRVRIFANIDVGGYAWARRGFNFRDQSQRELFKDVVQMFADSEPGEVIELYGVKYTVTPSVIAQAQKLIRRWRSVTPLEVSRLGERARSMRTIKKTKGGRQVPVWPGKSLMLGSSWYGIKPIKNPAGKKDDVADYMTEIMRLVDGEDSLFIPGDNFEPHEGQESDYNILWADLLYEPSMNPSVETEHKGLDYGTYEEKGIRRVRDPEYWGAPYGTVIVPGMKPAGPRTLHNLYHGTRIGNLDGMLESGARSSEDGGLGSGFYVTRDTVEAIAYSAREGDSVIVRGQARIQKPKVYRTVDSYYRAVEAHGGFPWDEDGYAKYLKEQGYDAIVVGDHIVLLEPELFEPLEFANTGSLYSGENPRGWTQLKSGELPDYEEKGVRRVRDPEYWGVPYGTIIAPGMKPVGQMVLPGMPKRPQVPENDNGRLDRIRENDLRDDARRTARYMQDLIDKYNRWSFDEYGEDAQNASLKLYDEFGVSIEDESSIYVDPVISTGDWPKFGACRNIRESAYDILGFSHYDVPADPYLYGGDPGWGGAGSVATNPEAQAYYLLSKLRDGEKLDIPAYRGVATYGLDPETFVHDLQVDGSFDLPLASFTGEIEVAKRFGTGVVFKLERGSRYIRGGFMGVPESILEQAQNESGIDLYEGDYEDELRFSEIVSGGRFKVTHVKQDGATFIVTIRQVGVFNPDTGVAQKSINRRWKYAYLFDNSVMAEMVDAVVPSPINRDTVSNKPSEAERGRNAR